jgi:hypothetical protein
VGDSFLVVITFVTKVQVKGLTHFFNLLLSFYKVYKEGGFSLDFTLKIMCHLGWVQKNWSLKAKHKIK